MLTDLPGEIICDIFAATASIETALRLARTCRRLNNTWLTYRDTICMTLLPECLPAYDLAQSAAQLRSSSRDHTKVETHTVSVLDQGREAGLSLLLFIEDFVKPWGKTGFFYPRRTAPPYLSKSERLRYLHAYQLTKSLILAAKSKEHHEFLTSMLQSLSAVTYFNVRDVAEWLANVVSHDYRTRWPRTDSGPFFERLSNEDIAWWRSADADIFEILFNHPAIAKRRDNFISGYPDLNPEGKFTLFDQCQEDIMEASP